MSTRSLTSRRGTVLAGFALSLAWLGLAATPANAGPMSVLFEVDSRTAVLDGCGDGLSNPCFDPFASSVGQLVDRDGNPLQLSTGRASGTFRLTVDFEAGQATFSEIDVLVGVPGRDPFTLAQILSVSTVFPGGMGVTIPVDGTTLDRVGDVFVSEVLVVPNFARVGVELQIEGLEPGLQGPIEFAGVASEFEIGETQVFFVARPVDVPEPSAFALVALAAALAALVNLRTSCRHARGIHER